MTPVNSKLVSFCTSVIIACTLLSSCAFFSDGVVQSVEMHYVSIRRAILSVSGELSTFGTWMFSVTQPLKFGVDYASNPDTITGKSAVLKFQKINGHNVAEIILPNGTIEKFTYRLYGGRSISTVVGFYW